MTTDEGAWRKIRTKEGGSDCRAPESPELRRSCQGSGRVRQDIAALGEAARVRGWLSGGTARRSLPSQCAAAAGDRGSVCGRSQTHGGYECTGGSPAPSGRVRLESCGQGHRGRRPRSTRVGAGTRRGAKQMNLQARIQRLEKLQNSKAG